MTDSEKPDGYLSGRIADHFRILFDSHADAKACGFGDIETEPKFTISPSERARWKRLKMAMKEFDKRFHEYGNLTHDCVDHAEAFLKEVNAILKEEEKPVTK